LWSKHLLTSPTPSSVPQTTPLIAFFCFVALAVHIAVPLSYYLEGSSSADERFRWRMFSTIRMRKCSIQTHEIYQRPDGLSSPEPIPLQRELHFAWQNLLSRGRPAVWDRFLKSRCQKPNVHEASIQQSCNKVATQPAFVLTRRRLCQSGEMIEKRQEIKP
jgi:hypothetical protein